MLRLVVASVAVVFFIIGVITLPTPIPIGLIFLGISLSLLVMISERARGVLRNLRKRYPKLNNGLIVAEQYLPNMMVRALQKSTPDRQSPKKNDFSHLDRN